MKYRLRWPNSIQATGQITTSDEVVIEASENMEWSIGRTLYGVLHWAEPKGIEVYVLDESQPFNIGFRITK